MGWKMVYNSLDKNRENREKMLLTFAKNSIRSKPPPSFRAVYHNKNHVITNTDYVLSSFLSERFTLNPYHKILSLNLRYFMKLAPGLFTFHFTE